MPSIALPVSLRGQLLSGTRTIAFSPVSLFAANEPGVWFDPSDLTTLFADPAGTTPVTTPGQTVGLMLDKSKGLALGAENLSGWSNGATYPLSVFSASGSGFTAEKNATSLQAALSNSFSVVSGKSYRVELALAYTTSSAPTSRYWTLSFVSTEAGIGRSVGVVQLPNTASPTTFSGMLEANFTGTVFLQLSVTNVNMTGTISASSCSVRELAGNHATQATLAARPTYSIEPVGGRRNLLLQTEAFNEATWAKQTNVTVTANTHTAPNGTLTADTITATTGNEIFQISISVLSGLSYAVSLSVRKTTGATVFPMASLVCGSATGQVILNTNTGGANVRAGVPGATNLNVASQGDYWRLSYSVTSNGTSGGFYLYPAASSDGINYAALSGSQVIWGAQLELGSTATAYQRVTTQYDVTEAGVASVGYLYFDGASDNMVTSTITPGIDKAQVFAGVRKLAAGRVVETSLNADTNNGSLYVQGNSTNYEMQLRGDTTFVYYNPATFNSPITNVVSCLFDIAGALRADEVKPRIDGVLTQTGGAGTSSGGGNFLAYPLYIGSRAGSLAFLNGHLYSLITRFGPVLDAPTIASTETWVAGKTGFYTPIITGVPTIGVS